MHGHGTLRAIREGRRSGADAKVRLSALVTWTVSGALMASACTAKPSSPSAGRSEQQRYAIQAPPTAAVGGGPTSVATDSSTQTLYSTNQNDNSISIISTATCNREKTEGCKQTAATVQLSADASPQAIAVDAVTGTAYVADLGNNTISVFSTAACNATNTSGCGHIAATVANLNGPINLAVNESTDTIYVANLGANSSGDSTVVSVINGATCNGHDTSGCDQPTAAVSVGEGPDAVAVDQSTDTVYVANDGTTNNGNTVSVINGATCNGAEHAGCGQVPPTINVGTGPFWIALDATTHTAYTANNTNDTVSVINTATCNAADVSGCSERTATVSVGHEPYALTIDEATHTVFVANNSDDTLSIINSATCNATNQAACAQEPPTSQVGAGPQSLVTDPTTNTVYSANFVDNTVSVVNPANCNSDNTSGCRADAPSTTIGGGPIGVAIDQRDNSIYVANAAANTVSVIDAATCNATRIIGCASAGTAVIGGAAPATLAINDATHTVYVVDRGSSTVSVINDNTCNATMRVSCAQSPPTISVGANPYGIAIDQSSDTVYVTNLGTDGTSGSVSVINGATCNATDHAGCGQTPPTVTVGRGPYGIAVDQSTDTIYVANYGDLMSGTSGDTISVINGRTCNAANHASCAQAPRTITVGPYPYDIAVDQADNTIYVDNNNNGDGPASLSAINGATCDAAQTVGCDQVPIKVPGIGRAPVGIALDAATHTLYTANLQDASVSAINTSGGAAKIVPNPPRIAVGSGPLTIAIDTSRKTVYVFNSRSGTVTALAEQPVR